MYLRDMFMRPQDPMHYRGDIQSLRRRPNETPQAFELRVRQVVALAYPRADQVMREELGIQIFLDKISLDNPILGKEVGKSRPSTLHDARDQLQFLEDLEKTVYPSPHVRQTSSASMENVQRQMDAMQLAHQREVAALRGQIDNLQVRTESYASQRPKAPHQDGSHAYLPREAPSVPRESRQQSQVRCRGCNEIGHIISRCPKVRCYGCYEMGHMKSRCPNIASDARQGNGPRLA